MHTRQNNKINLQPAPCNQRAPDNPQLLIPFFPRGYFTLLLGLPGSAKSLLATHLAALNSVRSPLPPEPYAPHPFSDPDPVWSPDHDVPPFTILCACEDSDTTVNYRLSVALDGQPADQRFIRVLGGDSLVPVKLAAPSRRASDDTRSPLLRELNSLHRESPISLIILDPLPAFLDMLDATNNPALVRKALDPLLDFTCRNKISVVGITHLNKKSASPLHLARAAGSYAYAAMARSVLLLATDMRQSAPPGAQSAAPGARRLLIPIKNNFAPITHALAFSIQSISLRPENPLWLPTPYLHWEKSPISLADLPLTSLTSTATLRSIPDCQLDLARRFLLTSLSHGPLPSAQLQAEARSLNLSRATLTRALATLQTTHTRDHQRWYTSLTQDHDYSI